MWPRLIAQLIELLPHVTRLVPMADSYFASRASGDRAHATALNTLGESLGGNLATLSNASAALSAQLAEQSAQIAALQAGLKANQAEAITQTRQVEWLTKDLNSVRLWVKFGTATILLLLAVNLALFVKLFLSR